MSVEWRRLLNPDIATYINAHKDQDVSMLALRRPKMKNQDEPWPWPLIFDQIKSYQKAAKKIPYWQACPDIVYPSADIIEQASSFVTAAHKASLVSGVTLVDLTAGAGVDLSAFTKVFQNVIGIEKDQDLAGRLDHNMHIFHGDAVTIINKDAAEYARDMASCDCVYIDPQRRYDRRKGLFRFEDCSPDVTLILPDLLQKTKIVIIKASPVLDIRQGIKALKHVRAVHVVEYNNDCKEILFVLDKDANSSADDMPRHAVILDDAGQAARHMVFTAAEEKKTDVSYSAPLSYLYEPSPAFMKTGGYNIIAARYGLKKLHPHTHLYTSDTFLHSFPGRAFRVVDILPVQRKAITLKKANLTVRNFPMHVEDLRKKLGISEGGDSYIFACAYLDKLKTQKNALVLCLKP